MKTIRHFRIMTAIAVIMLSALASGCKKDAIEPSPENGSTTPPPVQQVNRKPVSIVTLNEQGDILRKQLYQYNSDQKLRMYISKTNTSIDSVLVNASNIDYRIHPQIGSKTESLHFFADNTFKFHRVNNGANRTSGVFTNNGNQLASLSISNIFNSLVQEITFNYQEGNLRDITTGFSSHRITYRQDLRMQKGINEIPGLINPIKYFKLLEQEGRTSTLLYDKLIRSVSITQSTGRTETHEYDYTFDAHNRVTKIKEVIRVRFLANTTEFTQVHEISYDLD